MDQGVSAVLGASVAVVGTLATAVLTYTAARRQTSDQARAEQVQRLRDERRSAYLALLEATEPIDRVMHAVAPEYRNNVFASDSPDWPAISALAEEVYGASQVLYRLHSKIQLVGPDYIENASDGIWRQVRSLHEELFILADTQICPEEPDSRLSNIVDKLEMEKERFAIGARNILQGKGI
ncbi:hypothetical protein [Streptomyces pseudovenezuelae]|uniref:Secreted protein n=1 Tax=Streptomyces pseudovenezuelae TaxID=67350 RepID=A0ABT6LTS6_9ACTN|nr:hypothetical protein [Streptomyces pseudovenezuelae]MDH6219714.1 hypothetical protein [Streptomyces pseudovenezuelae]